MPFEPDEIQPTPSFVPDEIQATPSFVPDEQPESSFTKATEEMAKPLYPIAEKLGYLFQKDYRGTRGIEEYEKNVNPLGRTIEGMTTVGQVIPKMAAVPFTGKSDKTIGEVIKNLPSGTSPSLVQNFAQELITFTEGELADMALDPTMYLQGYALAKGAKGLGVIAKEVGLTKLPVIQKIASILKKPLLQKEIKAEPIPAEPTTTPIKQAEVPAKQEIATVQGQVPTEPVKPTIPSEIPKELEPPVPPQDDVQIVMDALKESKSLRAKQEQIYTQERAKRIKEVGKVTTGGEAGFYERLSKLKGDMDKVEFETLKGKVSQQTSDNLFNQIQDSVKLNEWEKLPAQKGLAKLFGEFGGSVPTEGELSQLNKVFGQDFTQALLDKRTLIIKMRDAGYQLANIPRSVMSSFDMSAPLRQGVFLVGRPKQFFPAFVDMFKSFGSENMYKALNESITQRPTYKIMQDSKLALTEMGNILSQREERFMSNWAEKIPVLGKFIRASGRAYGGFLNKLRADVFDDIVKKAEIAGLKPLENADLTKSIASFVNTASGRGNLAGGLERAAVVLNSTFFSPRLMASRISLLNPVYYAKLDPFVRKEALKSLLGFTSVAGTVLGLSAMAGAKVGLDPRSSDFLKIKIGNTRLDIGGGFQQYLKLASQLISGKLVSSTTGKVMTLGEGYKPLTRKDILLRFAESKEAPIISFATGLLEGVNAVGEKFNVPKEIGNRFVPMVIGDMVDIAKDNPNLLPLSVLGSFGVGLQTYKSKIVPSYKP